ncbi:M12 family metallopeptidase [Methylobacterium sp. NFXW15]|uniref:M12 family metallopeptidase n=1 Tax=Methylobacterium sp. NFXW15 TaxID=2819512 RepID=UPI003CE70535
MHYSKTLALLSLVCVAWTTGAPASYLGDDFLKDVDFNKLDTKTKSYEGKSQEYKVFGDILLPIDSANRAFSGRVWKDGKVVYAFDDGISTSQKEMFRKACGLWEVPGKLKCVERISESNFVVVSKIAPDGVIAGQSVVGMPSGVGHMDIVDWNMQTLVHEIGHMIGKAHEHQRSDAAQYIDIHLENTSGSESVKYNLLPSSTRNHNPIDFDSCMFYFDTAFSKNGQRTIVLKSPYSAYQNKIGKAEKPSKVDKEDISFEYR